MRSTIARSACMHQWTERMWLSLTTILGAVRMPGGGKRCALQAVSGYTWGKRAQESISRGAGDALLYSLKQAIVIYFQNTMPPQNRKLNKPKLSQLRGQNASVMVWRKDLLRGSVWEYAASGRAGGMFHGLFNRGTLDGTGISVRGTKGVFPAPDCGGS